MIVANRATLSGIIQTPFLFPAGQEFSGDIRNNIRLDLSSTPLGFGRMRCSHEVCSRQNYRFGSFALFQLPTCHFRSIPISRHPWGPSACPKRAGSRQERPVPTFVLTVELVKITG